MGQSIGYARVSSVGQSLEIQLEKLSAYGCDKVYREKRSGTTDNRPELQQCLAYLREGDRLIVTKLDRLARSTNHLTSIAADLAKRGIELVVLDQGIDTSTPTGRLLFNILATIAQFETEIRKERQTDGITKAKSKGVQFGRKNKLTDAQILELNDKRKSGVLIKDLMNEYELSKASIYRLLSESSAEEMQR